MDRSGSALCNLALGLVVSNPDIRPLNTKKMMMMTIRSRQAGGRQWRRLRPQ